MFNSENNFRFPKKEKLCSKKHIDTLFEKGNKAFTHPLSCNYINYSKEEVASFLEGSTTLPNPQVLFIVPKKIFKRAHDRNKVKRLLREAYRLERANLLSSLISTTDGKTPLYIQFFSVRFVGKEIPTLQYLQEKIIALFKKIAEKNSSL